MKKCEKCGNDNLDIAKFCDSCGAALTTFDSGQQQAYPQSIDSQRQKTSLQRAYLRAEITGKEFSLQEGEEYSIGRGDPGRGLYPEIALDDALSLQQGVSRLHAKVIYNAGQYNIIDLNSTNRTRVNGRELVPQKQYGLHIGDIIELGNYKMAFLMR